jgi:hypothetical protein
MAIKFSATMNAINRGLEHVKPAKGVQMIEDWETALADLDLPGSKGILRDLEALKKQLEKDAPDGERVQALLHRLGAATLKIATRGEKSEEKLKTLGEALTEVGEESHDEEEDVEATKNPKRTSKKS